MSKGESEAIVLPLDPDLVRNRDVSIPKLFAQKLSVTLSVLEAKLNADTGNPTYIRIMSVLDLKGRFSPLVEEGFCLRMRREQGLKSIQACFCIFTITARCIDNYVITVFKL